MSPAIEVIIARNEHSLQASEEMLTAIALTGKETDANALINNFEGALSRAENNITEAGETAAIEDIKKYYPQAFSGDEESLKNTVNAISTLSRINRQAMVFADKKAKHIGSAGAWGIVFMGTIVFLASMIIIRYFNNNIAEVVEEINSVVEENTSGNTFRRCYGGNKDDAVSLYSELNTLLDKVHEQALQTQSNDKT